MTDPSIHKAARIHGHQLVFRDATAADAEFIHSLRTDPHKSKHLSTVSNEVQAQINWLTNYAARDDEAYFIIENRLGEALGTVRLYDARQNSFCWGSWIIKSGAPSSAAIESALIVYRYALDHLGFRSAHFDVRTANEGVWSFHERFGARRTGTTGLDHFYEIDESAIRASLDRYRRMLPTPIRIE